MECMSTLLHWFRPRSNAASADFDIAGRCKAEKQAEQLCGNYTAILDKDGNAALKGVLAYEGYTACKTSSFFALSTEAFPQCGNVFSLSPDVSESK